MQFLERLVTKKPFKECETDRKMNRREFQKSTSDIKMPHHYCGYTNRILIQRQKKSQNYYIPVYVIFKIKSIQSLQVQNLVGSISCVIIINVLIQNLSEPLVHLLETQMNIQLNRSELIQLKENNENGISCVNSGKFLRFTIRKNVTGAIIEDTLWSPFQIISLTTGFTFNSIKKEGSQIFHSYYVYKQEAKAKEQDKLNGIIAQLGQMFIPKNNKKSQKNIQKQVLFDTTKNYTFSFNCMRNGSQIPISYSLGCGYALYDLAQRRLESYHTNLDSYVEVMRKFEDDEKKKHEKKQDKKPEQGKDKKKDDAKEKGKSEQKQSKGSIIKKPNDVIPQSPQEIEVEQIVKKSIVEEFMTEIFKAQEGQKKQKAPKAKYFQFSHFVIPLYKYPVNSLLTIFIPIFLLALLSLAIFFQDNDLSSRIGSIATMVLGYIALIPSIKEQLPPSSKITIIQRVIYVSTLCCLFSLVQSFLIDGDQKYTFIWYKNQLFLLCLFIHISVFVFVGILLTIHIYIWEPSYNFAKEVQSPDPQKERHAWINLYCDEQFYKANSKIYKNNLKDEKIIDKTKGMYIKYTPTYKDIVQQQTREVFLGLLSKDEIAQSLGEKTTTKITNLLKEEKKQTKTDLQSQSSKVDFAKVKQEKMIEEKPVKAEKSGQKKGEKQEKKDKQSKPKKPVLKLKHQDSLSFLDEVISSGSHIVFKEKEKPKPKSAVKPVDPMKSSSTSIKSTSSTKNSKID